MNNMKSLYLTFLSTLTLTTILASDSPAQATYGIESGVTSLRFSEEALDGLGMSVTGSTATVDPFVGYEFGMEISPSTKPIDQFCFELNPFTPYPDGIIEHSGTIELSSGVANFSVGNFEIAFDSSRYTESTYSGFFVTDRADLTGSILFDVGHQASDTIDGSQFTWVDSDLLVSPEFAAILGDAGLSGTDVGELRVDGVVGLKSPSVPEPSTAILALLGSSLLFFRRMRA